MANINFVVKNDIELKGNLIFEGTTPNSFETTLAITDPTSDRTITFPNSTGTVALTSDLSSYLTTSSASTTYVTKNSDINDNVKLGTSSMKYLTTGEENVAIGHESIGILSTGYGNVGIGFRSLSGNEFGAYNVALGYNSLSGPTGSNNIAIGQYAGNSIGSGSYNVVIGSNDGSTISNSNNNVIIADGQGNIRIQANSNGIVTMPAVPAFSVYASFLQTQSGNLTYNATNSNNGGHMNIGTGLFTAPVSGYYNFNYYGFVDTGLGGNTTITFQKNGAGFPSRAYNDFNDASYGPVITISAVIYLAANDNVRVNITGAGVHGNDSSFFSGFLIG